jgi:enamine deaminase RidA (YjgF/YER057c/UK114 family)
MALSGEEDHDGELGGHDLLGPYCGDISKHQAMHPPGWKSVISSGREKINMTIERIKVGTRMSQAVVHGQTVYLAGQVADEPNGDVADQTRQILAKIDGLLAEAGTDKSKVVFANIWLSDISTFDEMNVVWDKWVSPGEPPARATVESKLAGPQLKVEIMVVAAR